VAFTFIDLFAGCGGFSLGFRTAGFQEKLAVERSGMAAETYIHNLIHSLPDSSSEDDFKNRIDKIQKLQHLSAALEIERNQPEEDKSQQRVDDLEEQVKSLEQLVNDEFREFVSEDGTKLIVDDINNVNKRLEEILKDKTAEVTVDVVVGGPPCQGFSLAGKRGGDDDPRNSLVHSFREFVFAKKPKMFVMENVVGIGSKFKDKDRSTLKDIETYFKDEYRTSALKVNAKNHGVPQSRPRRLLVGISNEATERLGEEFIDEVLQQLEMALDVDSLEGSSPEPFTTKQALAFPLRKNSHYQKELGRLEKHIQKHSDRRKIFNHETRAHAESTVERFEIYHKLAVTNSESLISLRLARSNDTEKFWRKRLNEMDEGRLVKSLSLGIDDKELSQDQTDEINKKLKERRLKEIKAQVAPQLYKQIKKSASLFTSKHSQRVLPKNGCSPTIMTIPDDYIHYEEPRTLTVREMARLQSFPDQFVFRGKVTTGGKLRKHQVPQYTQVGNAVPPLLAYAIAEAVEAVLHKIARP